MTGIPNFHKLLVDLGVGLWLTNLKKIHYTEQPEQTKGIKLTS